MNTGKKRFNLTRENAVAGTLEVSKGGPESPPLAHDLAGKGVVSPSGQHDFPAESAGEKASLATARKAFAYVQNAV